MSGLYYLHGILLPNGSWIKVLDEASPGFTHEELVGYAAGSPVPSYRGGFSVRPKLEFTTSQVKTILDTCGLWGYDASAGNCDLYYRLGKSHSHREAAAEPDHLQIRYTRAFLYWTKLSASEGKAATVTCTIVPTSDGTNPPVVPISAAIPTELVAGEYYGLSKFFLNGAEEDEVTEWELDMGVVLDEFAGGGGDYLTYIGVARHNPVFSLPNKDLSALVDLTINGLAITSLSVYLRQRQQNKSVGVALATASHIKISGSGGMAWFEGISGGSEKAADGRIKLGMTTSSASLVHPLSISTASAITN